MKEYILDVMERIVDFLSGDYFHGIMIVLLSIIILINVVRFI